MKKILREAIAMPPVRMTPLAEQKRIVARVEELLRWSDTLEAQLHQTRTLSAHSSPPPSTTSSPHNLMSFKLNHYV